jgi:mannose-6-phosphate isomerase-like protein (cupin superfamily)
LCDAPGAIRARYGDAGDLLAKAVPIRSFRPVAVSGLPASRTGARAPTRCRPRWLSLAFLVRAARGGFNRSMGDKTIIKVDSTHSPHGPLGQMYLATGVGVGMRLWRDRPPGPPVPEVARDYETVGYVISGRAELHSEGQMVLLEPGNAWVVPRHARHTYKILEPFTAVEATHPPAEIHDRDRPVGQGNRSDSEQDSG